MADLPVFLWVLIALASLALVGVTIAGVKKRFGKRGLAYLALLPLSPFLLLTLIVLVPFLGGLAAGVLLPVLIYRFFKRFVRPHNLPFSPLEMFGLLAVLGVTFFLAVLSLLWSDADLLWGAVFVVFSISYGISSIWCFVQVARQSIESFTVGESGVAPSALPEAVRAGTEQRRATSADQQSAAQRRMEESGATQRGVGSARGDTFDDYYSKWAAIPWTVRLLGIFILVALVTGGIATALAASVMGFTYVHRKYCPKCRGWQALKQTESSKRRRSIWKEMECDNCGHRVSITESCGHS